MPRESRAERSGSSSTRVARPSTAEHARGTWLHLDARTHDDNAVAWQAESFGGIGGDVGRRDEQPFAPLRHRLVAAPDEFELGQKERRIVQRDLALSLLAGQAAQRVQYVSLLHIAVIGC